MNEIDNNNSNLQSDKENEIILYQPDSTLSLDVRVENETVWLTQAQMTELFQTTRNNITLHIRNIFKEGELEESSVCKESLLTAADGKRYKTKFYSLDVIISVGYRVKSIRGTQFRIWANKILKDYLLRGYSVNQRLLYMESHIDRRLLEHDKRLDDLTDKVDFFIRTSLPPKEGVFFNRRLNSTLKLMRILNVILVFMRGYYHTSKPNCKVNRFTIGMIEQVTTQIYQEVKTAISFTQCQEYAQLEVLYLLIIMRQIRENHPINPDVIRSYLNLHNCDFRLNAICFNVMLYYIGNATKYEDLKLELLDNMKGKFQAMGAVDFSKDSESVIFAIDLACCPYLKTDQKKEVFKCMNLSSDRIDNLSLVSLKKC